MNNESETQQFPCLLSSLDYESKHFLTHIVAFGLCHYTVWLPADKQNKLLFYVSSIMQGHH